MTLNIKHPKAEQSEVAIKAVEEGILRLQEESPAELQEVLLKIGRRCATLPDCNPHPPEAILGYDQFGLPPNSD